MLTFGFGGVGWAAPRLGDETSETSAARQPHAAGEAGLILHGPRCDCGHPIANASHSGATQWLGRRICGEQRVGRELGQVDSYEQKLQEQLGRQACGELVGQGYPRHPNPANETAIRGRGEQQLRSAPYRYAAADLTRIDGISAGAARTIMTEIGTDLSAIPSEKRYRQRTLAHLKTSVMALGYKLVAAPASEPTPRPVSATAS